MYLDKIEITGFRNLKEQIVFSFTNDKNLIFGPNGSGKTSILEAIYLLGFGRSFLNVKKGELLNINSRKFFVNSTIVRSELSYNINAVFDRSFSLFVDGEKTGISGAGRYIFPLFFSSNDYVSIISSRSSLRKLFDKFIFGTDILYSDELIEYKKIIRHKTSLLKHNPDRAHLHGWNKLLAKYILKIMKRRFKFIELLNKHVQASYCDGIELRYSPSSGSMKSDDNQSEDFIVKILDKILEKEIAYKNTLIGTHLDKFEIFLNNRHLGLYSSGEKKINLFFIYLAYIDIFLSSRGEYPLFLVDDYDIAMDDSNIAVLMEKYPSMQIIATSVRINKKFDTLIKLTIPGGSNPFTI